MFIYIYIYIYIYMFSKTSQFKNINEIYICFLYSYNKETLFDEKTKGVYISYIFFQLQRFRERVYI